jgi:ATP-binding cassette subfamily B protein
VIILKHIIQVLSRSVKGYKKETILAPLCVTLEVLMECIIPLVVSRFINELQDILNQVNVDGKQLLIKITIYGLILVALAFASLFGGAMSAKFGAKASAGFAKNLRRNVYYHIQEFSFENIDHFSTPSLVTRLTTDITNVQQSFGLLIRLAVRCPLILVFSIVLSFTYHPTLPLIFLAVIPLLALGLVLIILKAHPLFKSVFKKYDNLNNTVQENIRGMRVVKAYVREDYEIEKFDRATSVLQRDFTRAERIMSLNNPLMTLSMYICMTLISFFGACIIVKSGGSELAIGDLTSLTTYTVQMLSALMMFSFVFLMLIISSESARRIVEVLDEEVTLSNPENPVYEVENGDISFKDVSFKYSAKAKKYALRDVNLEIKSGQTIGIIGGTGSSKSTLVNLISRLYDVTEGELLVGGKNVKEYDLTSLRNQVACVLQKNVLFSGSIKENLRWGNLEATDDELVEACKLAQADEFIQSFPDKYDTYIEQGGSNVSGGQKQRLCIARALLKKPKILILDDSTSAVDTKTDALIRNGFKHYIPNTTKIIIAQRIASVQDADLIVVMDNGAINEVNTHEELLAHNTIYQEVYYSQNKVNNEKEGEAHE